MVHTVLLLKAWDVGTLARGGVCTSPRQTSCWGAHVLQAFSAEEQKKIREENAKVAEVGTQFPSRAFSCMPLCLSIAGF